jgi:hypothetical protein
LKKSGAGKEETWDEGKPSAIDHSAIHSVFTKCSRIRTCVPVSGKIVVSITHIKRPAPLFITETGIWAKEVAWGIFHIGHVALLCH